MHTKYITVQHPPNLRIVIWPAFKAFTHNGLCRGFGVNVHCQCLNSNCPIHTITAIPILYVGHQHLHRSSADSGHGESYRQAQQSVGSICQVL